MNDRNSFPKPDNNSHEGKDAQAVPAVIEAADLKASYANFVRVSGTPEELVLDFGLNTQQSGADPAPVKIVERLVVNHYTAKRLYLTLGAALQRHEQVFGALETDISKRVIPSVRPNAPR